MADGHEVDLPSAVRRGQAVVLQTYPNVEVLNCLQALVGEVVADGRNVVVLGDARSTRAVEALRQEWSVFLAQAHVAEIFHFGTGYIGDVSQFIDVLRDPDHAHWISRIGLILVPRGEEVLARPYVWELMAYAVRDRFASSRSAMSLRTVVVLEPRRSPEPAIRDALPLYASEQGAGSRAWSEAAAHPRTADRLWWNLWTSESSRDYFNPLRPANDRHFAGANVPLAQFAGRWGIQPQDNWLLFAPDSGDLDHVENLQRSLGHVLLTSAPAAPWDWATRAASHVGAVTISEDQGNPWRSLHRAASCFTGIPLVNLVVRSSLLCVYQIANAGYFSNAPLQPVSPLVSREVPFDTAMQLVQRLYVAGELPLDAIRDALVATDRQDPSSDPGLIDPFNSFVHLVERELGSPIAEQLHCAIRTEWAQDAGTSTFDEVGYVFIASGEVARAPIAWLDEFDVADEAGTVFDRLRREHVSQQYWPRKVVLFEGKKFTVDKVDFDAKRVVITHDDERELPDYRPERVIMITQPSDHWTATRESFTESASNGLVVKFEAYRLSFSVSSSRVVRSFDHWAHPPQIESHEATERAVHGGRVARLQFIGQDGVSLLNARAAIALAAWLNEAAVTLLPEASKYIIVAPEVDAEARPEHDATNLIVPLLKSEHAAATPGAVWIFEDSQSDLGVIRALADDFWYFLDVCFDWLSWSIDEYKHATADPGCLVNLPAPARDWFAFGAAERDPAIGLSDLKAALQGFQEMFREVWPNRRTARGRSMVVNADGSVDVTCDICGTGLEAAVSCDVLPDGRMSCKPCSSVGVKSLNVLERLYREVVVPFYREAFGVADVSNVRVELVDQNDISRLQGKTFIPTSGFDMRAIGLAVRDGVHARSGTRDEAGRHLIQIESGFSAETTACTLAHELCHVWQFNMLDFDAMKQAEGDLLIEGHALWVERQLVNSHAAVPNEMFTEGGWRKAGESIESLARSSGIYGEGFRRINELLGSRDQSAFEWLRQRFAKES